MPPQPLFDPGEFLQGVHYALLAHQRLYDRRGVLGDITLRDILDLDSDDEEETLDTLEGTPFEAYKDLGMDTPLQSSAQFKSLRRVRYPDSPWTLQDHLETFYYVVLAFAFTHCHYYGGDSVTRTLMYIRDNYIEGNGTVITRGSDGLSALIAKEARIAFKVVDNRPLTRFLNEALVGIWAWHAHHQVIDGGHGVGGTANEVGEDSGRTLYLSDHKMMLASLEKAVDGLREMKGGVYGKGAGAYWEYYM